MKNNTNKRRQFIKNIGMTAMGLSTMPAAAFSMKTWAAAAANNSALTDDYRALVCFYMFGGNDGFNMLVPKGDTEYAEYQTTRSNLALAQEDLLSINPLDNQGMEFGLHPSADGMQQLFEDGKLSFLCNVGTKLKSDTTVSNFQNQQNLPLSLFSHNDQTTQWMSANVEERSGIGWAGRIADMLGNENTNQNISMNVSLGNNPTFLRGEDTSSYSLTKFGPQALRHYSELSSPDNFHGQRTTALNSMFNHDYQDPFYNTYNGVFRNGIDSNSEYKAALDAFEDGGGLTSDFTEANSFSQNLKMVAKSIAIGEDLGFQRQIFFVQVGGFDQHDKLLVEHSESMSTVSTGLLEFNAALEELDMQDQVVTFSMSDFGRTLTSNGDGSDHAWGSNAIVMGGPVIGKSLFGDYPSLALGTDIEVGKGTLIPTMASDLYCAELAHWFGVPMSELGTIFPNLSEFFDASLGLLPVGFLNV